MGALIIFSILYWIAVGVLFVLGIIRMVSLSSKDLPVKPGLNLLIISVVMLVIGVGACAAILGGL